MKLFGVLEDEINKLVRIIIMKEGVDEHNLSYVVPYEPTSLESLIDCFLRSKRSS